MKLNTTKNGNMVIYYVEKLHTLMVHLVSLQSYMENNSINWNCIT